MTQQQAKKSANRNSRSKNSLAELTRLWICRLLVNGRGYRAMDQHLCIVNDDMCGFVGLDPKRASEDRRYTRDHLRRTLQRSENKKLGWPEPLGDRLERIGYHLSLDTIEKELLALMTVLTVSEELRDAAQTTVRASRVDHTGIAALALNRDEAEIAPLLHSRSRLTRSGLLQLHVQRGLRKQSITEDLAVPAIELLDGLATALTVSTESVDNLLARYFQHVDLTGTPTFEFDFLAEEARRIGTLVDHALAAGEHGFNILIHGVPGVGKTEFIRTLAARHDWELYSVSDSDTQEQSLTGTQRFRAYQLSQYLLTGRQRGVLMFDEIEDVFDPHFTFQFDDAAGGTTGKSWTNRILESNVRPVIWISNGTDALDPAYLRRFDYILRVEAPPRETRRRLLNDALADTGVPQTWIESHAREDDMTPARIAQIGRLGNRLSAALDATELPEILDGQIEQHRSVQRDRPEHAARRSNPLDIYELDYVNSDPAASELVAGLREHEAGTVLMHGPPGTGKTAFAEHVAERLDRELITHSASGLLDKYVGETEKALARMFSQAQHADAVLLLDEADNFLSAREGARQRWELTETNELLVQMERFRGIVLCATNQVDALDPAGMRRFDVKMEFHYLSEPQRWSLFVQLAKRHGLSKPIGKRAAGLRSRLARLDLLTPGDFAAVVRGNRLVPKTAKDHESLITRLENEQRMKPGAKRARPGFV